MKILVAIACYGHNNDAYLQRLIDEYRTMPYQVDIAVVSNIRRELAPGVEVFVGLPAKNPWTLPFAHKKVFAERLERYDLFIYSEDDTLITQRNIEAFLEATRVLPENEIAGFLRTEQAPEGTIYYSTVHRQYHWDARSVCRRGNDVYAFFTNEHGACYLLTQAQLRRAIQSGGFLVPPHEGQYDLLVSAATDPYTQCGMRKLLCVSRLDDFTAKHLTNKYIGKTGVQKSEMDVQIAALLAISRNGRAAAEPMRTETRLGTPRWAKHYYEPQRDDLLAHVPADARQVLSIGCGWGKTEEALVRRGVRVVALPLDEVIGACAAARGVEVLAGGWEELAALAGKRRFDAAILSNVLHLAEDPRQMLRQTAAALAVGGVVVASCPNVHQLSMRLRKLRGVKEFAKLGDFRAAGVHEASHRAVRGWFRDAGLAVDAQDSIITGRWRKADRWSLGAFPQWWAEEIVTAGHTSGQETSTTESRADTELVRAAQ